MKYLVFLIFFCTSLLSIAQHEVRVGLNSGLSAFSGKNASATSWVNFSPVNVYANSPMGTKPVLSYGASVNYKYLIRNIILGIDGGYENLRMKTDIESYFTSSMHPTSGRTVLSGHFITVSPFIGYRIPVKNLQLDLQAGFDLQKLAGDSFREKGEFVLSDGDKLNYETTRNYLEKEIRPRIQLNSNYKRYTVYAGYSFGLLNYYSQFLGGSSEAYLNTLRFGLQYRLL